MIGLSLMIGVVFVLFCVFLDKCFYFLDVWGWGDGIDLTMIFLVKSFILVIFEKERIVDYIF